MRLFLVGLPGEYILQIHIRVQQRPLVMARERISFGKPADESIP